MGSTKESAFCKESTQKFWPEVHRVCLCNARVQSSIENPPASHSPAEQFETCMHHRTHVQQAPWARSDHVLPQHNHCAGATFLPLRTSCLDPDFLAAFEASLRGQHSPTTTPEIMQASHYAWGALSLCPESVGAETLSALLSIAATIRKLMLTVMPYPTTRASSAQLRGQQQRLPVEDQPGGPTDALKRLKLLSDTQAMELTLPAAIASLNRLHAARADNGAAGPGGTTTGDSGDESPPGPGPCPEISLLQQLHAIICITFVQVFRWRVAPNASYFNNVQWLPAAGEAFQHLPNPELTTLMASAVNTTALPWHRKRSTHAGRGMRGPTCAAS